MIVAFLSINMIINSSGAAHNLIVEIQLFIHPAFAFLQHSGATILNDSSYEHGLKGIIVYYPTQGQDKVKWVLHIIITAVSNIMS